MYTKTGVSSGTEPATADRLNDRSELFRDVLNQTKSNNSEAFQPASDVKGNAGRILLADASNFQWQKFGLDGRTANGLGFPEAKNTAPNRTPPGPTTGKGGIVRGLAKATGLVTLALLINEGLHELVGPPPILKLQRALGKDGDLAITMYGPEYAGPEAEPGTAFFTRGMGGERLNVPVTVTDEGLQFDPEVLQREYGKPLPEELQGGDDTSVTPEKPDAPETGVGYETRTQEEADLASSLASQGKNSAEIQNAIANLRSDTGVTEPGSGGGSFRPAEKNYEYSTVVRPRPNSDNSDVFVLNKDQGPAKNSTLAGNFINGDFYIGFYSSSVQGQHIGREMISAAIEKIGPEKVKTVTASFDFNEEVHTRISRNTDVSNLNVYREQLADGKTREEAIWATPLGRAMNDLGFNTLEIKPGDHLEFTFGFS